MYKIMNATKKLLAALFALTLVAGQALSAQTIKTPAFAQPLVEQWVNVYNASHPDAPVTMAAKGAAADIQVVVSEQQELQLGQQTITFGRYAILPFASQGSEAAQIFGSRRISKSRLEHIYFNMSEEEDEFGDYADANKGMTIYSGNSQATVAETRQLKQGIQLLRLDVKRDVQHALEEGNLDNLLTSLEENNSESIATAEIGLNFNAQNQAAYQFVAWVLTEGIKYNHQFGLLNNEQELHAAR